MGIRGPAKFILAIIVLSVLLITLAVVLLSSGNQKPGRSGLLPENTAVKGRQDAKVYLVEFSDFQCPACKAYQPIVDSILKKYGDRIAFGYRHFPLPQHQFAKLAAQAAEAAGEQDKFWEMHDYLFANQERLSDELIKEGGRAIGLDEQKFGAALNSSKYNDKISKDLALGQRLGVDSTPTFFLNGRKLNLGSLSSLEKSVEEAINNSR